MLLKSVASCTDHCVDLILILHVQLLNTHTKAEDELISTKLNI